MDPETVNIGNICGGAVPEVFDRELQEILKNIGDINTDADAKRKITLEFEFSPLPDRTGAIVTLHCKSKVAPVEGVSSSIFVLRDKGQVTAYTRDVRQQELFNRDQATNVVTAPIAEGAR